MEFIWKTDLLAPGKSTISEKVLDQRQKRRTVAGKGARNPVVTGPAASEGSLQWLAANKLHL